MAGAALQVLFRNPLADPALVGVSSGAALATAIALIAPGLLGLAALPVGAAPIAAFAGGVAATLLALRLARRGATTSVSRLILVGVAINAVAGAGTGLLSMLATDAQLRSLSFWLLGSLGGTTWRSAAIVAPVVLTVLALLLREHRRLDLLLLGEREARHLGVPVERVTRRLVVVAALGVGAAVAVSGMIGFVGLLVPHAVRLLIGPTHRLLLPTTALAGAALLPAADLLARSIAAPVELPIGAVMALLGGPAFLVLVARSGDTT
ncbi:MAG: iron ABC transporter permease [Gemmatimonadaceae bacterium]|nr:iron ABC transporter permease [Gemmatimonadaceae bacterium]